MADEEERENSGEEPTEEVGPGGAEAPVGECELEVGERDGGIDDAEFTAIDEVHDAFETEHTPMVLHPGDKMPVPADEQHGFNTAPPFSVETVVCIEDDSEYVELFVEELLERGWTRSATPAGVSVENVGLALGGRCATRDRYDDDGVENERHRYAPAQVKRRFGQLFAMMDRAWIPVRPKRERCEFYKRQLVANHAQPDPEEFGHKTRHDNCTKRRSVGGAFMKVGDEGIFACDYRQPPDPETMEKYLDAHDRERLASKRHLKMVSPFNLG